MNILSVLMLIFAILGGLDRILGNRFGLGKEFERGFQLLGAMALTMIGMIVLAPWLAQLLAPCFDWIHSALGLDPSIIPASLFANDMGGAPLSQEVAADPAMGMFNAMVVSSMMGATLSFSIPYALNIVEKERYRELFLGILCGIATIPVGCLAAGLMLGLPLLLLLVDLLPLLVLSAIIGLGLLLKPELTVKIFSGFGFFMKALITVGLLIGIFQTISGIQLIQGLGSVWEGAEICLNAAMVLSGAFPLMYVVGKLLKKPLKGFGRLLGTSELSAMGFVSSLVTNATTLEQMNRMDRKGILLNSAFMVSGAFVLGSHLAFTAAYAGDYLFPVLLAKSLSGVAGVLLALALQKKLLAEKAQIAP